MDYYLESLGARDQAEQRVVSALECIRAAERRPDGAPPKVGLFARFLEFCELDKALPLPMLDTVLQAKRIAQVALLRPEATSPGKPSRDTATKKKLQTSVTTDMSATATL